MTPLKFVQVRPDEIEAVDHQANCKPRRSEIRWSCGEPIQKPHPI
jgi:hypothetical protein